MNREITQQEKDWLVSGLNTLETGEYNGGGNWVDLETNETLPLNEPIDSEFYFKQINDLRAKEKCPCGDKTCHTIKFQHFEMGKSVGLVTYHTDDKRMLIIHVHEDTNMIAELEII